MGNFQSTQKTDERPRSNRLYKRRPSLLAKSNTEPAPVDHHPHVPYSVRSVSLAPGIPADIEVSKLRVESLPPPSAAMSDRHPNPIDRNLSEPILEEGPEGPYAPSRVRHTARRSNLQPYSNQSSTERHVWKLPKRARSVDYNPHSNGMIFESSVEEVAFSNTHFPVQRRRSSLIRRKSLLTRPGIATRAASQNTSRAPSPIRQESDSQYGFYFDTSEAFPPCFRSGSENKDGILTMPHHHRDRLTPPGSFDEYSHLGVLKLGSLRVVNCSVSPCPSEHSLVSRPGHKDQSATDASQFSEEHPFFFEDPAEKTSSLGRTSLSPAQVEDEGIALHPDEIQLCASKLDDIIAPSEVIEDKHHAHGRSTCHAKTDSGYSSANSVCSLQQGCHRKSIDSQEVSTTFGVDTLDAYRGNPRRVSSSEDQTYEVSITSSLSVPSTSRDVKLTERPPSAVVSTSMSEIFPDNHTRRPFHYPAESSRQTNIHLCQFVRPSSQSIYAVPWLPQLQKVKETCRRGCSQSSATQADLAAHEYAVPRLRIPEWERTAQKDVSGQRVRHMGHSGSEIPDMQYSDRSSPPVLPRQSTGRRGMTERAMDQGLRPDPRTFSMSREDLLPLPHLLATRSVPSGYIYGDGFRVSQFENKTQRSSEQSSHLLSQNSMCMPRPPVTCKANQQVAVR